MGGCSSQAGSRAACSSQLPALFAAGRVSMAQHPLKQQPAADPTPSCIAQAALGVKPKPGAHVVFVEKDGQKFAIGTLEAGRATQFSCDITFAMGEVRGGVLMCVVCGGRCGGVEGQGAAVGPVPVLELTPPRLPLPPCSPGAGEPEPQRRGRGAPDRLPPGADARRQRRRRVRPRLWCAALRWAACSRCRYAERAAVL